MLSILSCDATGFSYIEAGGGTVAADATAPGRTSGESVVRKWANIFCFMVGLVLASPEN